MERHKTLSGGQQAIALDNGDVQIGGYVLTPADMDIVEGLRKDGEKRIKPVKKSSKRTGAAE